MLIVLLKQICVYQSAKGLSVQRSSVVEEWWLFQLQEQGHTEGIFSVVTASNRTSSHFKNSSWLYLQLYRLWHRLNPMLHTVLSCILNHATKMVKVILAVQKNIYSKNVQQQAPPPVQTTPQLRAPVHPKCKFNPHSPIQDILTQMYFQKISAESAAQGEMFSSVSFLQVEIAKSSWIDPADKPRVHTNEERSDRVSRVSGGMCGWSRKAGRSGHLYLNLFLK